MSHAASALIVSAHTFNDNKMNASTTIKKVVIVGGGSAGWMTAMILADALIKRGIEITVLESPVVGVIGVGEGSTPALKGFFDALNIEESEWMPECNATFKCGITFDKWSTKPGYESYFHPFASVLDNFTMPVFVKNVQARIKGIDVHAHPNRFFIATHLADNHLAPKPNENFPFSLWYGYHFDSVLLGQYLHKKAIERGVRHKSCHVEHVNLAENGDIASVTTAEGETIEADFFVDCTGFSALLIEKALKTPFVSFSSNLFNDSAVAMPSPLGEELPSQTVSTALKYGWAWKIPLTNRYGNGYVYSSSFCTPDQAEFELRERLGLLESDIPARHLKMKLGRVTKHWNRNCLAVGLSQGFIEPLEATALLFIQRTASTFVEYFEQGDLGEKAQDDFNFRTNTHFEGTRDYIVTHYKTNSRTDTEYWKANSAGFDTISDSLKQIYGMWSSGDKRLVGEITQQNIGKGYPVVSWYSLMAGMGMFTDRKRPPEASERVTDMTEIDNLLRRSALNFKKQKDFLANIPKQNDKLFQIYFW